MKLNAISPKTVKIGVNDSENTEKENVVNQNSGVYLNTCLSGVQYYENFHEYLNRELSIKSAKIRTIFKEISPVELVFRKFELRKQQRDCAQQSHPELLFLESPSPWLKEFLEKYKQGYRHTEPLPNLNFDYIFYGILKDAVCLNPHEVGESDETEKNFREEINDENDQHDEEKETEWSNTKCSINHISISAPYEDLISPKEQLDQSENEQKYIIDEKEYDTCEMAKWICYFREFYVTLAAHVNTFESDIGQKKFRFALKRTILDKINFSAKKHVTNTDLSHLFTFFVALFHGQPVISSEGNQLQIADSELKFVNERGRRASPALNYAMFTVAQKYIEQIKWDLELLDTVVLVMVHLAKKVDYFYDVFCAVILNASVFLGMSIAKVLEKAFSFERLQPEAATLWIASERAIFRLFAHVQIGLKTKPVGYIGAKEKMRGDALLAMFLEDTFSLTVPIICSSAFVVSEIIENYLNQVLKWVCRQKSISPQAQINAWAKAAAGIYTRDWSPQLTLIERRLAATGNSGKVAAVLRTRNDALLCVLKHTIEKKLIGAYSLNRK